MRSAGMARPPSSSSAKNAMPADSAYVDTSVLGAYYCPEPLSGAAEAALLALRDPCISPLTEVEFTSLVARKRRLKELRARDLIGSMAGALSTLDALHLSVALSAGMPLLTADRDFARAARRHDATATLVK